MSALCRTALRRVARRARLDRARRHGLALGAAPQAAARRQPDRRRRRATSSASRGAWSRSDHGHAGPSRASRRRAPARRRRLTTTVLGIGRTRRTTRRSAAPTSVSARSTRPGGLATTSLLDEAQLRGRAGSRSTRPTTRCSIRCAAGPTTSRRSRTDGAAARSRAPAAARASPPSSCMLQARARARDRAGHRVHRRAASARCASRRASSSSRSARARRSPLPHLHALEEEVYDDAARDRVRARLRDRARASTSGSTRRRSSARTSDGCERRTCREARAARRPGRGRRPERSRECARSSWPSARAVRRGAGAPLVRGAARSLGEPVWDGHYYDFGARHIAERLRLLRRRDARRRSPCGIRGATTRSATADFSRASTGCSGDRRRWSPTSRTRWCGALLAVVTYLLAREALSPWRARWWRARSSRSIPGSCSTARW